MIDIPNQANSAVPQSPANESPSQLTNAICKKCQTVVQENFYFCPNCGKKLKEPPFRFS